MARLIERLSPGRRAALAGAALFLAGSGVGAGAMYAARPVAAMAPVTITPVASLASADPLFGDRIASVRGRVAAIYGSRFTLSDASGTTLVEAGRRGGDGLVSTGQTVTVQGRFDDGVLHAAFLVGPDGTVTALAPHGPGGHRRGHGRRDAAPPPPGTGAPATPDAMPRPATPPADGPEDGPDAP